LLAKIVENIKTLQYRVGLPSDFRSYNISYEDFEKTVAAVSGDPAALNFPMPPELIRSIGEKVVQQVVKS
jgi:alcohol dehydrogenase class IV